MSQTSPNTEALPILGGLSAEAFLSEVWQKKPLLIKGAIPDFTCPVSPDELAGLSMEAPVESRIVLEHGKSAAWELQTGPFDEETFANLPATHWTLLIQQLDAWVPEVNALKSCFNFIPNWRIDDIMASYAPFGGSVGPHFDYYDVFLLQAQGHRRWQTGQRCDENSERLPGTELSILKHFECEQEWTLGPGDMLYLPPGIAHYGVAQDDCITLSVGFRAPSHAQLVDDFSHHIMRPEMTRTFYQDPENCRSRNPGEIAPNAMQEINAILDQHMNKPEARYEWFVGYASSAKNPETLGEANPDFTADNLRELVRTNACIYQNEGSRFVYYQHQTNIILGVDGRIYKLAELDLERIQLLCQTPVIEAQSLVPADDNHAIFQLVLRLIQEGSLYC